MALLPLMKPTTWETAYWGGVAIILCTWSRILDPAFFLLSQGAKDSAEMLAQLTVEHLSPSPGYEDGVIFAIPL